MVQNQGAVRGHPGAHPTGCGCDQFHHLLLRYFSNLRRRGKQPAPMDRALRHSDYPGAKRLCRNLLGQQRTKGHRGFEVASTCTRYVLERQFVAGD